MVVQQYEGLKPQTFSTSHNEGYRHEIRDRARIRRLLQHIAPVCKGLVFQKRMKELHMTRALNALTAPKLCGHGRHGIVLG